MPKSSPSSSPNRRRVRKALLQQYKRLLKNSLITTSDHGFFQILEDKITQENCGVRPLFARWVSEYLIEAQPKVDLTKKEKSFFYQQLPFILECVISIQYYHNQILDEKSDVSFQEPPSIKRNLIKGNLLERELFNYVYEQVDEHLQQRAIYMLMRIFQAVDMGQHLEQETNLFMHFKMGGVTDHPFERKAKKLNFIDVELLDEAAGFAMTCFNISQEHAPFLYRYFERIYLISSVLFIEAAKLICDILGINRRFSIRKKIEKFAGYFGLMMQVVNDVCDCSLVDNSKATPSKTAGDAFADLKNKVLTFPLLYHYLNNPKGYVAQKLYAPYATIDEATIKNCYREMIEQYSQFQGIELGRKLKNEALTYLSDSNKLKAYLEDLSSYADVNQYYTSFYRTKAYKRFKKIKKQFKNSSENRCNQ